MSRPVDVIIRARQVYQNEGLMSLTKRGFTFLRYCLFVYRNYYFYSDPIEHVGDLNEADFLPKFDSFIGRLVSSNEEAEELEAAGLLFRAQVPNANKSLDSGAVASVIFIDNRLAHIGWVALSEEGQKSIGEPPYSVDFSNHEGCAGGSWTHPRYRRLGLRRYSRFVLDSFLLENGIRIKRTAVAKNNIPGIKSRGNPDRDPCGEGRYIRILWWKSWKERRLPASPSSPSPTSTLR